MKTSTLPTSLTGFLDYNAGITIHAAAQLIAETLEAVHGYPFKVKIGNDCSFVFVTRDREGSAS